MRFDFIQEWAFAEDGDINTTQGITHSVVYDQHIVVLVELKVDCTQVVENC